MLSLRLEESVIRLLAGKHQGGLSIAELLVASGLLAVVLVTVMTLFGQLLKNTNKNSMLTAGAFFADGIIEKFTNEAQIRVQSLGNAAYGFELPGFTRAGSSCTLENGEGYLNVERLDNATKYLYRLEAERLDGFAAADKGQLWKLTAEVRWWQADTTSPEQARSGMGNLSVERSRIVYLGTSE